MFAIATPPPPDPNDIEADGGRWIMLPGDGRVVEYFVFGSERDDASILVDCPGGGCTGALAGRLPGVAEWLREKNVRVISPSFPGFGRSEVRRGWTIGEWPRTDLEPILEKEGVAGPFAVTGTSFGGPHAMAAAVHFGPDRVGFLGLRVPFIDWAVSEEVGLPLRQAEMQYTSVSANTTLVGHVAGRAMMAMCANPAGYFDEPSLLQRAFLNFLQPKALANISKLNEEHADTMQCIKEDLKRGVVCSGQGWLYMTATDMLLDQKFDVRNIDSGIAVVVWYADDDEDCPPSHGAWLVKELGAKSSRVFSGLGHIGAAFVDHVQFLEEVMMA